MSLADPGTKLFQLAYVTTDRERAKADLASSLGTERFTPFGVIHPDFSAERSRMEIDLAYVGEMMVELITPAPDGIDFYRRSLPREGYALRLHHLGYLVPDEERWRVLEQRLAATGTPIAMQGSLGDALRFVYADTETVLSHNLEWVMLSPGHAGFFANVERN